MTERFVHDQNLRRFEMMLLAETDPQLRRLLERLLSEERAKVVTPQDPNQNNNTH